MASRLDWIGAWARATERELGEEAFRRDVGFLPKIVPLMALWSRYFDGEVRGLERVPATGPVLLVGNHSGGPLTPDTGVFFAAWYRARGLASPLVGLAFDAAFGIPWFRDLMRRIGEVPASRRNAARALDAGLPVLVYPGGDHECFRPWTDRGRIDFAGRKGFVELALAKRVPVVPVVSHGGHHSTCIVTRGDWIGPLLGADLFESWMQYAPPKLSAWWMRSYARLHLVDRHRPPVNVIVSSVPGPRSPLAWSGGTLEAIYSVGPVIEGTGLNVTAWSYVDALHVGTLVCPDLVPDPHAVPRGLHAALAELTQAANRDAGRMVAARG